MSEKDGAVRPWPTPRAAPTASDRVYAALDLGTNNCRLLVARAAPRGFKVIDSFSRIVRLGEGVAASGQLSDIAMERTLAALAACAEKLAPHQDLRLRAIATQACRVASNGAAFLARVKRETGIGLEIVTPREEARLSVLGCRALIDPQSSCALIIDIGGGSTELSWVETAHAAPDPRIMAWTSIPVGVVSLAEQAPETEAPGWYEGLCGRVRAALADFHDADALKPVFQTGYGHVVGTSGAVSSLAGVHLDLKRYVRSRVDGLWMSRTEMESAIAKLRAMSQDARAAHACIGAARADLVAPGAAILETVCAIWPTQRVRVADRGLREGVILELIAQG